MTNAPKWPMMIRAVYASFGTGQHLHDDVARRVMDRVVSWLAAGKELSPRLQAKLLDNIRMRTRFQVDDPGTPIRLSRNQLSYARRVSPEWFGLDLSDDLEEETLAERSLNGGAVVAERSSDLVTIQLPLSDLSAIIQRLFSDLSATFQQEAVDLARELTRRAAENCGSGAVELASSSPKVMESEAMIWNHGLAMLAASPGMNASGVIGQLEEVMGQDAMPWAAAPIHDHEPQAADAIEARHDGQERDASQPGHEEERHGQGAGAARADAVTIWIKEDRAGRAQVSGYLDLGPDKYALRWSGWDHAIARIEQPDPEWAAWAAREVAGTVIAVERGSAGLAARHTTSALYERGDRWARARPVSGNAAVVLEWEGDVPARVVVIAGDQLTVADVIRETNDRWKAVIK